MSGIFTDVYVRSFTGVIALVIVWLLLYKAAHLLLMLLRRDPLIGWGVGPFGITMVFLHEPSLLFLWLDVLFPALVSGSVLYIGLFSSLRPIEFAATPFFELALMILGICLTSFGDLLNALRDLRHPLWGEARILRTIQILRASWSKIHFTPYGQTYLSDHFGANANDLLQVL
jgi:hypothetical protein